MKKRQLLKKAGTAILLCSALVCGPVVNAVILIPPTATTNVYPTTSFTQAPTSCFAFGSLPFGANTYDPYISAWGDKVVWRLATPGSNSSFGAQGQLTISGASGIKVTMIYDLAGTFICAVYRNGSSFYLQLYIWNGSSFVTYGAATLLSSSAGSKISIDAYAVGRVGIVWDEIQPVTFQPILKCKFSNGIAFTGNFTLAGTTGHTHPDIAMTRTSTPSMSYLNGNTVHAHIVSQSGPPAARVLMEFGIPVEDMYVTSTAVPYSPFVEDVNYIGLAELNPEPVIDCPDFDYNNYANWAYAYVKDGDICGRFSDYNAGTVATAVMTDGSMGNAPITLSGGLYYANFSPTITYNNQATSVFVGWRHSMYPVAQNIAGCVEVKTDGSNLISAMDYLAISLSFSSSAPVFSKHTMTANYLYANTLEYGNTMTHYFHNWGSPDFKPGLGIDDALSATGKIGIYPNPFTERISVNVPASLQHRTVNVTVTDILGKTIFSELCKSEALADHLSRALLYKPEGTYLLNIRDMNSSYCQKEKLVKAH